MPKLTKWQRGTGLRGLGGIQDGAPPTRFTKFLHNAHRETQLKQRFPLKSRARVLASNERCVIVGYVLNRGEIKVRLLEGPKKGEVINVASSALVLE